MEVKTISSNNKMKNIIKELPDTRKNLYKRRKKILNIFNICHKEIMTFDKFNQEFGYDIGLLCVNDRAKHAVSRVESIAFWDGIVYAIEHKITSEKELMKRVLKTSKKEKDKKRGMDYLG